MKIEVKSNKLKLSIILVGIWKPGNIGEQLDWLDMGGGRSDVFGLWEAMLGCLREHPGHIRQGFYSHIWGGGRASLSRI